jgi:hypothetical protein
VPGIRNSRMSRNDLFFIINLSAGRLTQVAWRFGNAKSLVDIKQPTLSETNRTRVESSSPCNYFFVPAASLAG